MKKAENHHETAAMHYDRAAAYHRRAAELLEDNDPDPASTQAHLAHAHALRAHEHAGNAARQYMELHGETQ